MGTKAGDRGPGAATKIKLLFGPSPLGADRQDDPEGFTAGMRDSDLVQRFVQLPRTLAFPRHNEAVRVVRGAAEIGPGHDFGDLGHDGSLGRLGRLDRNAGEALRLLRRHLADDAALGHERSDRCRAELRRGLDHLLEVIALEQTLCEREIHERLP